MKKLLISILLGEILFSALAFQVKAQSSDTTLELTVQKVEVVDGDASITGLSAGSEVELYNNLGEELISSGRTDSAGMVVFIMDDQYPLSGKGVYHTLVMVDGFNNGMLTCQQGQTCQETVFSVSGLDPDHDDALMIVKAVRSDDLITPVEGVQVNVWPADAEGQPLTNSIYRTTNGDLIEYNGIPCISNEEGYCVVHLEQVYRWEENKDRNPITNTVIKFGNEIIYDTTNNWILEGSLHIVKVAVDQDGRPEDCIFKTPPRSGVLSQSCQIKIHQTATAQVEVTIDPIALSVANNAVVQASLLGKDTADLFAGHEPDQAKITEFLTKPGDKSFNQVSQVKVILSVEKITNDGYNAFFSGPAIGAVVEITSPDNPDKFLGACEVNSLGECVSIIERSTLLAPDGFLKFRALADGYDNGILICKDALLCEQQVYTSMRLLGKKDAVLVYKLVDENNYLVPVPDIIITAGETAIQSQVTSLSLDGIIYDLSEYSRGCVTDENGACPIYVGETGFAWKSDDQGDYLIPSIYVTGGTGNDMIHPYPRDDQLVVYQIAVNNSGRLIDCTFSSPLTYPQTSPLCSMRKSALQTAIAGYTATSTVTVTPFPSMIPTATEVPPTLTFTHIPTATPRPGFLPGGSTALAIGGIALLILLLGGGAWLILRSRAKK